MLRLVLFQYLIQGFQVFIFLLPKVMVPIKFMAGANELWLWRQIFAGNLAFGDKVFWPHWRFSVADVLLAAVVGRAFKAKSAACNNSNHSHQQVGAGTPLRGARVLHVML